MGDRHLQSAHVYKEGVLSVYVPCSVETQCYCFSQASQPEFYKPSRILQAQTSAMAVGRGLEPSKISFPNSRMPIQCNCSACEVPQDAELKKPHFFLTNRRSGRGSNTGQ
jgi:hypothetical protein